MILTSRRRHFYLVGQSKHKVGACGVNNQASAVLAAITLNYLQNSCEGLNPAFAPTAHVMVWGAIAYDTRSPLVLIRGSMTLCDHIMSALDLRSGFLQMAVNPSHIVKTAFVTKNGTYAFRRMPFGLSGNASNFQKAID
ncbi:hypothetical protein TNCV_3784651 [Trichonephila clavipes]|nr:hypothetical protein TNCV_3784651 [Trichonephila clavipes]